MDRTERLRLLGLAMGYCATTAVAQTVGPQTIKDQLLDARARELVRQYPGNKDAEVAVTSLLSDLKQSDKLKTTVVLPCPPSPAPAPSGSSMPKIADAKEWPNIVGPEAKRLAGTAGGTNLTVDQKDFLKKEIAPAFSQPGDPTKFATIVVTGCPTPAPSPSGDRAPAGR